MITINAKLEMHSPIISSLLTVENLKYLLIICSVAGAIKDAKFSRPIPIFAEGAKRHDNKG